MRPGRRLPRSEWAKARRIGASDVAKILGVSPYGGPWDVWMRLHGRDTRGPMTDDQARGHLWEPTVIDLYRRSTGFDVRAVEGEPILIDGPEPWSTVSPDGFVLDAGETGLCEAKTDRFGGHWGESREVERWDHAALEGVIRPDYALQCYAQMFGADVPFVDLVVLLPFYELRSYRLWRDPDVEAELVDTLGAWWRQHGEPGGAPPDIDGSRSCSTWLSERFRAPAEPRAATAREAELALRHAQLSAAIKQAEDERRLVGNELLASLDGAKAVDLSALAPKARATVVGPTVATTFDAKALAAAHPELDLSPFRRASERAAFIRTFNLTAEE
jgi:predicted phage-related endonuclease